MVSKCWPGLLETLCNHGKVIHKIFVIFLGLAIRHAVNLTAVTGGQLWLY